MLTNIIVGVGASVIASFVWFYFTQLYSVGARSRINLLLIGMRTDNYLFEKALDYKDYNLALDQVERMIRKIEEICSNIKTFTYIRTKKQLIFTCINNLYNALTRFKHYYIGYDQASEKETCCEKAQRELFILSKNNSLSTTLAAIELLVDLNKNKIKRIKNILLNLSCLINGNIQELKEIYKKLIDVNSFKGSFSKQVAHDYQITSKLLTRKQYEKIIDKLGI